MGTYGIYDSLFTLDELASDLAWVYLIRSSYDSLFTVDGLASGLGLPYGE